MRVKQLVSSVSSVFLSIMNMLFIGLRLKDKEAKFRTLTCKKTICLAVQSMEWCQQDGLRTKQRSYFLHFTFFCETVFRNLDQGKRTKSVLTHKTRVVYCQGWISRRKLEASINLFTKLRCCYEKKVWTQTTQGTWKETTKIHQNPPNGIQSVPFCFSVYHSFQKCRNPKREIFFKLWRVQV